MAAKVKSKEASLKLVKPPVEEVAEENVPSDEWSGLEPSDKKMGLVTLVLDKGVKTTAVGTIYGLDFEIEQPDYKVNVFFDYYNRRLKVNDYQAKEYGPMLERLAYLAQENSFDKIFVKAKPEDFQKWLAHGYFMEGVLKYFYQGDDAYILSRFTTPNRIHSEKLIEEAMLIEKLIYESAEVKKRELDSDIKIQQADREMIPELVKIYRDVFETYPSPLTNPDYIDATMKRNVIYRVALQGDNAIAAASAEVDYKHSNAEMTDCATVSAAQGKGLMQHILLSLESDLKEMGIQTAYTLARAQSYGMNKAFFRLGYEFSGRLINNCDIFGQFEDMNIWVKPLNS